MGKLLTRRFFQPKIPNRLAARVRFSTALALRRQPSRSALYRSRTRVAVFDQLLQNYWSYRNVSHTIRKIISIRFYWCVKLFCSSISSRDIGSNRGPRATSLIGGAQSERAAAEERADDASEKWSPFGQFWSNLGHLGL